MGEDPAHGPIGHLLCELRLKLLNSAGELRRDEGASAFRVVDFPAAGGEHHDIEAEAELVLELELRIPTLRALLVRYHIGQFRCSIQSCLILSRILVTFSIAISAYSASWFLKLS